MLELPRWEASPMRQDAPVPGPIDGVRLPQRAWKVLQQENITLDRLRAAADRLDRLEGIGVKTAQAIIAELARVTPPDDPLSKEK
jgi:hypothetical protein